MIIARASHIFYLDFDTREQRRLIRLQRRKIRQERINPRYANKKNPYHKTYHHRHLKLNDDYNLFQNDQEGYSHYTHIAHRQLPKGFVRQKKQNLPTNGRQLPTERQAGVAGLLAGNPAGAGLAWFASLVGLAAMAREPLATVLNGVTSWEQLFNSKYLTE